ncbi:Crp/Fnr family transcriptional regulator [Variovorax sp. WS11]|uniref:Crp/Fnr family transcriptional regulator n=1 Tax=Variovorax sp. WS11 TaxID=1105204 RepID=UPI000D0CE34E|nr:Crp/Fnr family transcriptional regulator [Variovorax sp. WS11]NDZ18948.1 Crp/Fnr family transcriptional regulator [Variovorax sp. WS11]PSL82455.1 Crp/Fnr family transcriptional regulator [Variovorax sp. WS11]
MKGTTTRPLREILEKTHWLRELPAIMKERVYQDAYEVLFRPGDVVVRKGDPAKDWLGVGEGLLKVSTVHRTGKVVMFSTLPEGSWGGEGTVFKRELFRYDMIAMRPSRVIHLPAATFRWLLDTSVEFSHIIISLLNERLATFMAMVEIDRLSDPVARVACAIGTMFNPVLHPHIGPLLTLSQTELGELIGMSRQSIGAALKRLESEGLISTEYGGIVVKSLAGLSNYQERD